MSDICDHFRGYIQFDLMIKEEDIFEEEEDIFIRFQGKNIFYLSDDIRNNINKRLPRGFSLLKHTDLPKENDFVGEIDYVASKRDIRVASQELAKQFVIPTQVPLGIRKEGREQKSLRCGQLPEGKSKQGEKIKGIIQRFRKHPRYLIFSQHLGKLGLATALLQIEAENRKNIHTIESFKQRSLFLFNLGLSLTYDQDKVALINEMVDQLQFLVENAQKAEFAGSLTQVQKSIDKVTRQISDIRETGSFFYRKKKRNEKNYDEKQLLYIAELIRLLPPWQLVGVAEIVQQKPFSQITDPQITFDLSTLKSRKIREIEFYVKRKLSNYYKSRERKEMKLFGKKGENVEVKSEKKEEEGGQKREVRRDQPEPAQHQQEIDYIFEVEDVEDQGRRLEPLRSMSSLEQASSGRNDSESNYSEVAEEDLFLVEREQSNAHRSVSDHSEMRQGNAQFQQPNLLLHIKQKHEGQDYDSSDSSYITDEQDSDF